MKYSDAWKDLKLYMNCLEEFYKDTPEYDRELVMIKAFKNTINHLEDKHE